MRIHANISTGNVFGVPVQSACAIAPCLSFFSGQQQHLPLIVFTVIEEIYARGMDVSGLFRIAGDEKRVDHLVRRFSVEPYGEDVDVNNQTIPDLCGLLEAWLDALPVPVLDPALERAFFSLVVCGANVHLAPDARVRVAQLLLRLLPAPNLSLFVYLVSFLSHFQRSTKLHIGVVAGLFAKPLAAKPIRGESENARRARRDAGEDAKEIVKWLLMNWHLVMDGLMDEPVLEVNPFGAEDVEPSDDAVSGSDEWRPSSTAAAGAGTQSASSARSSAPPIDPAYVSEVGTTLDDLSRHLAAMLDALVGMADAPSDLREHITGASELVQAAKEANTKAADEAHKTKVDVDEAAKLRQRVEEVEAEKAKVEKKLSAAHKALTAALAVDST
ncbi:Rho GTPase activation protein [Calocera viscosa TUFC12733]|uniref:Rho GTPase activation protein n=1 Tax=Calocera viscosa (strain TUFC12733) TaxID=1330018 RepID=A0A167I6P8_CALVF|nr:Rho GTPase activation protein [Calocera viscosa TUFC12733]